MEKLLLNTPVASTPDFSKIISLTVIVTGLLLSSLLPGHAHAAPGDLDKRFGIDGKVTADFSGGDDTLSSSVIQPDGKLVAVGSAVSKATGADFALARYNADGSLDTTFHYQDASAGSNDCRMDYMYRPSILGIEVALQADGKIVTAGTTAAAGSSCIDVVRSNSNGSPDLSFNKSGAVSTAIFPTDSFYSGSYGYALAIQADGNIVEAGDYSGYPALIRLRGDGSRDDRFGVQGNTADFGIVGSVRDMVIQPNGRIVVAGITGYDYEPEINRDFLLERFTADGNLDTSFGAGGRITTDFFGPFYGAADIAKSLNRQSDGKLIAADTAVKYDGSKDFALALYLGDTTSADNNEANCASACSTTR